MHLLYLNTFTPQDTLSTHINMIRMIKPHHYDHLLAESHIDDSNDTWRKRRPTCKWKNIWDQENSRKNYLLKRKN